MINYTRTFVPDYGGTGFAGAAGVNPAAQNRLWYGLLYDTGFNSYSAVTVGLGTVSTTTDVVNFYLYTLQVVPTYGYAPKDLIYSGVSLPTTGATGIRKTDFGTNISFSGYGGGGIYVYAFGVTNSGVTPTVRYNTRAGAALAVAAPLDSLGFVQNNAGTQIVNAGRTNANIGLSVLNVIQSSYTQSDIATNWNSSIPSPWGIALNTVR